MMNFCTYFDSYYIQKGLGLYQSLVNVTNDFHLYVMALDEDCYKKLMSLNLSHMSVELMSDNETLELLAVKPGRTKAEYYWTCGPTAIWHFLVDNKLPDITYLDSDLFFVSNPKIAFDELGSSSVGITEQGISEKKAKSYGKYCVQYLYFKNDENGRETLKWWRDSCIEWCFQRFEGDKYADQKYLDQFPTRFQNVHVFSNLGLGVATWNKSKYTFLGNNIEYQGHEYSIVFFHMHAIKVIVDGNNIIIDSYISRIRKTEWKSMYLPYAELEKSVCNHYLGTNISKIEIKQMSLIKYIEYLIRGIVRDNRFIQWLYFSVFNKKYKGHGQKMC